EAKQMIDLKRNLFKIDVRAQKDEEKVFMRTACLSSDDQFNILRSDMRRTTTDELRRLYYKKL
ncbi:hypothetical protein, partial [Streptococcus pyogenes]|uniref:hypothetical protein n=4 Tax=Streptococcus pyogenes TaxID=1314 RepID=UPI001FF963ED